MYNIFLPFSIGWINWGWTGQRTLPSLSQFRNRCLNNNQYFLQSSSFHSYSLSWSCCQNIWMQKSLSLSRWAPYYFWRSLDSSTVKAGLFSQRIIANFVNALTMAPLDFNWRTKYTTQSTDFFYLRFFKDVLSYSRWIF